MTQKLVEDTKKKGGVEPKSKGKVTKLKKKTVSTMKKKANRKLKMPQKTKQMNPLAKNRHDNVIGICLCLRAHRDLRPVDPPTHPPHDVWTSIYESLLT